MAAGGNQPSRLTLQEGPPLWRSGQCKTGAGQSPMLPSIFYLCGYQQSLVRAFAHQRPCPFVYNPHLPLGPMQVRVPYVLPVYVRVLRQYHVTMPALPVGSQGTAGALAALMSLAGLSASCRKFCNRRCCCVPSLRTAPASCITSCSASCNRLLSHAFPCSPALGTGWPGSASSSSRPSSSARQ